MSTREDALSGSGLFLIYVCRSIGGEHTRIGAEDRHSPTSLLAIIIVDVIEHYGASYIGNVIYCGGPGLTRALHNNYIHPYLMSMIPDILSLDPDVVAATAPKYVESVVEDMNKVLSYREQLMIMGGYTCMLPSVRIHLITRTQTTERWEKEIKGKQVLVIQGTHDRHSRADALIAEAKKWLGSFETLLLDGCGHSPVLERPHEINARVLSFIQRNSARNFGTVGRVTNSVGQV